MKENFLNRAKADGQVFVKMAKFTAKIGKLKLDIRSKKQQKDLCLKKIGTAVAEIYRVSQTLDGQSVLESVEKDFETLKQLDAEIAEMEEKVTQARADVKGDGSAAE